jgi:hypothetical protein
MRGILLAMGLLVLPGFPQSGSSGSYAVIVHQSNPTKNMRVADLRAFFAGINGKWPHGSKVVLVERDAGSATFRFLMQRILNMSVIEYKRRLASIEFAGEAPVNVKVLNSEEAACKFVFSVPGSLALIETNSLRATACSGVQIVRIDGKLPGEEGYRLR